MRRGVPLRDAGAAARVGGASGPTGASPNQQLVPFYSATPVPFCSAVDKILKSANFSLISAGFCLNERTGNIGSAGAAEQETLMAKPRNYRKYHFKEGNKIVHRAAGAEITVHQANGYRDAVRDLVLS